MSSLVRRVVALEARFAREAAPSGWVLTVSSDTEHALAQAAIAAMADADGLPVAFLRIVDARPPMRSHAS